MVMRAMDWLTRRRGETSTACRRTVPCDPIRVESSRGPVATTASTAHTTSVHESAGERGGERTKDLDGVLVGEKVDDFEGVGDDSDGHLLLTTVSSVHHQARAKN